MKTPMIQIDEKKLNDLVKNAQKFGTNAGMEQSIIELLEAEKIVSDALERVRSTFREQLPILGLSSVHGTSVSVNVSPAGARFAIKNREAIDPQFLELKLNTSAVEDYVEEKGKLPLGIEEKKRSLAVRIAIKKGAHD